MLQARAYDTLGRPLGDLSELGWSWNPIDWAKEGASWVASGAKKTWGGMKEGAEWLWDTNCKIATNPWMQTANAAAMAIPTGYTQIIGAAVIANAAACMYLDQKNAGDLPDPSTFPLPPFPPEPLPPPPQPGQAPSALSPGQAKSLPKNVIYAWDKDANGYRVAEVVGAQALQGAGLADFGAAIEIGVLPSKPASGQEVALATYKEQIGEKSGWYRNPWVWGAVGAGVLLVAGGAVLARR